MKVLLTLCVVLVAIYARNITSEVRGLRNLMKQNGDTGFFASCQIVLFSKPVGFDEAIEECSNFDLGMGKNQEGYLATVNDGEKNEVIRELLSMAYSGEDLKALYPGKNTKWVAEQWAWVGLQKTKNNAGKISRGYDAGDWQWAANGETPGEFAKWMVKQPDQRVLKKGGDCTEKKCYQNQMRINHEGKWDDTYKYKKHPYACDYQGKYILSATLKKWHAAKKMCEDAGLIMAKVRSKAENQEIVQAAAYFLGARADEEWDQSNWFWIGGQDIQEEGVFSWADGEEFDVDAAWIPWRNPNPDNAERMGRTGQDSIAISKWGKWDDSYTEKRARPFACMCPSHA